MVIASPGAPRWREDSTDGRPAFLAAGAPASALGRDPLAGESLFDDVCAYDLLGEHRAASRGDVLTTRWLSRRLIEAGLSVSLQTFASPLFRPGRRRLDFEGGVLEVFPAWPVGPTPGAGLRAAMAPGDAPDLAGKIAVVVLPYNRAAGWTAPGTGDRVMEAIRRGAGAVVAVTEGPTGDIIALNAEPGRFVWPVPVVLAPGREADRLSRAAQAGGAATLVSGGRRSPAATAANVVGRRPGQGGAIVVSTPKSGWFNCAGERGSGIAVFLALAEWMARNTAADLTFVATSGHELGYAGGAQFLKIAPPPAAVKAWLHLGANVAVQEVSFADGRPVGTKRPVTARAVTASGALVPAAHRAFAGVPGYETPRELTATNAAGELELFRDAGYGPIAGLLGGGPLFHTPADRAEVATTPAILAPVARASRDFPRGLT